MKKFMQDVVVVVKGIIAAACIFMIPATSWLPFNAIKVHYSLSKGKEWIDIIAIIVVIVVFFVVLLGTKEMTPLLLSIPYIAIWAFALKICLKEWDQIKPLQVVIFLWAFLIHFAASIYLIVLRVKDRIEMHNANKKFKASISNTSKMVDNNERT